MPEAAAAPTRARWPERVTLRDGSEIDIRPIRRSDKQRLRAGFERLSPESRYRRFFVPMPQLSSGLLKYLTEVDHHDHEALGALAADTGEGVGIARFVRLEDEANVAEVAVAVVDDWQGRGVATELLQRLAVRAREEGIERFSATCLAENREAIELFEEFGTARIGKAESGLIEAEIDLPIETGLGGAFREALRGAAARRLTFRPPRARHPPQ
jgi:RimJ/RimL family protein N-acetyltransferase